MIGSLVALGVGLVGFVVALLVLEPRADLRKFWMSRLTTALVVAVVLWKLTPLWTRWDTVFDNPLLLLSMNGGLAAVLGGFFAFVAVMALSLWQVTKEFPGARRWRLGVPVVTGLALAALGTSVEALWLGPGDQDPGPAAQMLVPDLEGHQHALADWRGRVVVVNFWATWYPSCLAELPEFQAFTQKPPANVVVVGVNLIATEKGGSAGVVRFASEHKMTWTQLTDTVGDLQKALGVKAVPTTVVLDPHGRVVDRREGAVDLFWLETLEGRFASH